MPEREQLIHRQISVADNCLCARALVSWGHLRYSATQLEVSSLLDSCKVTTILWNSNDKLCSPKEENVESEKYVVIKKYWKRTMYRNGELLPANEIRPKAKPK